MGVLGVLGNQARMSGPQGYPQPGYALQQPGYAPQQPGMSGPQGYPQPGYAPQLPGYAPQQPGYAPQQPGYAPQPVFAPQHPGFAPQQPAQPQKEDKKKSSPSTMDHLKAGMLKEGAGRALGSLLDNRSGSGEAAEKAA